MTVLAQTAAAASGGSEAVLFWIFAVIAVGAGIAMVTLRNIVHAALMLVLNFLCIAALYLGLQSSFLSIVQVIVYAGAIVVLFLFVIMLLGVSRDDLLGTRTRGRAVGAVLVAVLLAGGLLAVLGADSLTTASACGAQATAGDATAVQCVGLDTALAEDGATSVTVIGQRLFTRWTFAFELSALLLVVATLGALVLGRRKDPVIDDDPLDDPGLQGAARDLREAIEDARDRDVDEDTIAEPKATAGAAARPDDAGATTTTDGDD